MNNLKETALDKSKDFESKNKKAALKALEHQCELMHKSHELRRKNFVEDIELSKHAKELVMSVVNEMNSGGSETGAATGAATSAETGAETGGAF